MPLRPLGSTSEKVSAVRPGGLHIGTPKLSDHDAIRIIRSAIDRGLSFIDNSWVRMGKALSDGYRQKAFLMTKIDGRRSTNRCAGSRPTTSTFFDDPDRIFASGGAQEAVLEAKKAGKVAAAHGFHFDTVQMPLNVMDAHFRSFGQLVLPELVKQKIGVLGMKSMGSAVILKSKTVSAIECLHYAMNLPTSVVITGIDSPQILDQAFEAAQGKFELFKTSSHFDSTAQHPEWLGGETPQVKELTQGQ